MSAVVDDPRPSFGLALLAQALRSDLWLDLDGCDATLTANMYVPRAVLAEEWARRKPPHWVAIAADLWLDLDGGWLTITDCRRRPRTWPDLSDPLLLRCVRDAGYRPLTPSEHAVLEGGA